MRCTQRKLLAQLSVCLVIRVIEWTQLNSPGREAQYRPHLVLAIRPGSTVQVRAHTWGQALAQTWGQVLSEARGKV